MANIRHPLKKSTWLITLWPADLRCWITAIYSILQKKATWLCISDNYKAFNMVYKGTIRNQTTELFPQSFMSFVSWITNKLLINLFVHSLMKLKNYTRNETFFAQNLSCFVGLEEHHLGIFSTRQCPHIRKTSSLGAVFKSDIIPVTITN